MLATQLCTQKADVHEKLYISPLSGLKQLGTLLMLQYIGTYTAVLASSTPNHKIPLIASGRLGRI